MMPGMSLYGTRLAHSSHSPPKVCLSASSSFDIRDSNPVVIVVTMTKYTTAAVRPMLVFIAPHSRAYEP